ncbi:hypothetical protein HDV03_002215 [Kappamyces sp. JEL0829]|nr:hypothetical protein HDV03_002215 [Kappamyces sp. JEL0829]
MTLRSKPPKKVSLPLAEEAHHHHFIPHLYDTNDKKYEYFVDCCALRIDDLFHSAGIERPCFARELLLFSCLAAGKALVPNNWDWTRVASLSHQPPLDEEDCFEKYHGSNGLQLLRKSAFSVYGTKVVVKSRNGIRLRLGENASQPSTEELELSAVIHRPGAAVPSQIMEAVGGTNVWRFALQ